MCLVSQVNEQPGVSTLHEQGGKPESLTHSYWFVQLLIKAGEMRFNVNGLNVTIIKCFNLELSKLFQVFWLYISFEVMR